MPTTTNIQQLLSQEFGFNEFRPGQEEAITTLLHDKRLLCIQPTGHGKSLVYQLPALLLEGMTLVISPLLALMRDQIQQLNKRFNIPAASINSDQSPEENEFAMVAARQGKIRILFIAPEKLDNLEIYEFLSNLNVSLVVIDEAHCISTWGHDFRPSYRQIVQAVTDLNRQNSDLHVLGLTATANKRTEEDIAAQLSETGGPPVSVLRMSMDRPNIRLSLLPAADMAQKLETLAALLKELSGNGMLYCATREHTEIVAEYLNEMGLDVVAYHAGFDPDRKRALQHAFMAGKHKAIAATNALGMGIDKEDIRFIIHVDLPGSITAYYQEVGRSGRDGLPADGILLFNERDRRVQDHFIKSAQPTTADFMNVLSHIRQDEEGLWPNLQTLKIRTGLHPTRVRVIMAELEEQGFIEKKRMQRRQVYVRTEKSGSPDLARYERQFQVRNRELEAMLRYGDGQVECLMQSLRAALGDNSAEPCGRCSRCQANPFNITKDASNGARQWLNGRAVRIAASKRPPMSTGVAVFNSELRDPLFIQFMRGRAALSDNNQLTAELLSRIKQPLLNLKAQHQFGALLVIPSNTWQQREETAHYLATLLGIRAFPDLLTWRTQPSARQGELLNNEQRRDNVKEKMHINGRLIRPGAPPPTKAILLLDDYTGSGATIKEAVRAIRKEGGFTADIVPFTIARIRWRIGARGMI